MAIILPPNSTGTTVDTVTLAGKDREIIVLGDPATAANQAAVKSATPVAGDFGIVTRPTPRKEGQTLSTTNLGISGVFTQAFQDSSADGALFVEAAARADVASATNGFIIQESDDSADANFTRTIAAASVSANTLTIISAVVRARYWRVQYTNGGTAQTSFRLTSSASTLPEAAVSLINYDTTAGNVQNVQAFGVALPAAGGAVAGGTATNPVRTDPTGTTTQPVSGTVTANQGTAAAASSKWPIEIVDSAGVNIAAVSAANALKVDGSAVTQPVSIAAAVDVSDRAARLLGYVGAARTASDTLSAAGNSTSVSLESLQGAAMEISGTFTGLDLRAQVSVDGGTTFRDVDSYDISAETVTLVISAAGSFAVYVPGGASHVRARVAAISTGSVTIAMRASLVPATRSHTAWDRVPGSSDPAHVLALGASDGTNLQRLRAGTAAPAGTEQGLITRNIPSGTQTVSGTVTANAGTGTLATDPIDRAARLVGQVEGRAASGAAKAGNPNQVGGVFNTTQPTVTTGQAVELQATARGALIVASGVDAINVTPAANSSVNVAQIAGTATGTAAAGVQKVGTVGNAGAIYDGATAAAVPANAVYQGIRAAVANPTAVTVGQLVGPMADILGKQIVRLNGPRERLVTNTITLSTTTETSLIAAGAAGVFRDLVALQITNTSATAVRVDIRDATAGTVRLSFGIAANGGAVIPCDTPWPQTTAANAWTAQLSAAVTDIRINAMAVETA